MRYASTFILFLTFAICTFYANAQKSSSEIYLELEKLKTTGRVLYLAAHPDDENTRMISWLSNDRKFRTAYLSLTRGDGGQNLIGTQKGPEGVGIIRTQELLEARKIDGGEQYFTRAVDFGYSKSVDETLEFWNKEEILYDVVYRIRAFKPDVIITRFPPDKRAGHGHHTASAVIAEEAFELAADPNAFPEQLKTVSTWKVKRLFWNTSAWWDKTLPEKAAASPQEYLTVNIGTYNPLLGESHNEIAAKSRSSHRSQGFGAALSKGNSIEYLKLVKGDAFNSDIMDGVKTDWNRFNLKKIDKKIAEAANNFDFTDPSQNINQLFEARAMLQRSTNQQNKSWTNHAIASLNSIIKQSLGLHVIAKSDEKIISTGDTLNTQIEIILRNININAPVLQSITANGDKQLLDKKIEINETTTLEMPFIIDRQSTQPYWLEKGYDYLFDVNDKSSVGLPESSEAFPLFATLNINGNLLTVPVPVRYVWVDPAQGELQTRVTVSDGASIALDKKVYLSSGESFEVLATVTSHMDNLNGSLRLEANDEWLIEPNNINIENLKKLKGNTLKFKITPPEGASESHLKASLVLSNTTIDTELAEITFPHITQQHLTIPATSKLVHLPYNNLVTKVAYIPGAGDEIPSALKAIGIKTELISPENLGTVNLNQYETIILGIRAFNTQQSLSIHQDRLMAYVKQGGNLIVQYNTSHRLKVDNIGPYDIKLSRKRVTEENAEVTFIAPNHKSLNFPNKITQQDFAHWIQERGLYFAETWDDHFEPVISWHDQGESDLQGGLLTCAYGEGTFTYTGISFFRQLPAGIPGAYKLFINLINLNADHEESSIDRQGGNRATN
ncbi:PIG-L family deacetylase [Aureibacter tunicatorum]|uniref:LmbE family N-acetylglucosaminyl deacetylase n=1 Tax=Aureibacter tunicatorum TaxID=866807 RepID=A0AAE3XKV3_9BACT|nr:PIG-L family deacetylase [Aureibacter tunicatorum]MDR6238742.1 LmbE family N-acetylglucosaminyl deacetylase [Aureibacter tunicatorum]BDD05327.1 PIG-L domain-containing protein [Aureibacter tunicatorum]